MSRQTRLYRRQSRYYIRARIPRDLQFLLKRKEIKKTLKTSDPLEAVRVVRRESARLDAVFDHVREIMKRVNRGSQKHLPAVSQAHAEQLVRQWFVELEKNSESWFDENFGKLSIAEKDEIRETLETDEAVFTGRLEGQPPSAGDCSQELHRILNEHGVTADKDSPLFSQLAALMRKGRLEHVRRDMQRVDGDPPTKQDIRIWDFVNRDSQTVNGRESVSLGVMIDRFLADLEDAKRTEATLRAYHMPIKILKEILGEDTPLASITREDLAKVRDFLKVIPVNAAQRFKDKSLREAVRAADKKPNVRRLNSRTAFNYLNTISRIFNYAVKTHLLSQSPASDPFLKARFKTKRKRKDVFSIQELNKIFKAPLYTGCQDDEIGYAERGPYKGRRGRFWVPLLSLFHGLRLNEACQLYSEDVRTIDAIPCLLIRDNIDDGSETEKRLKTHSSERTIPIHEEILKMGFLDYVKRRRVDKKSHAYSTNSP